MIQRIVLILIVFLALAKAGLYHKTDLNSNWKLTVQGNASAANNLKSKVIETSVPTKVHLDLQKAGQIPNPLIYENYLDVHWISQQNYTYSTSFNISDDIYNHIRQRLTFEGIDTYSQIILNGVNILKTQNAFRKYSVYVNGVLKKGQNTLEVKIRSPKQSDQLQQIKHPMPFEYAHTRKACYQYSWDWAPYLNSMGIWKPVYLESFEELKLDYVWVRTRMITKAKAVVNFAIAIDLPTADQQVSGYEVTILQDDQQVSAFKVTEQYTYHDVEVLNPKLWWPNGIGQPHIYEYKVLLVKTNSKQKVDERFIPFGIRTVELNLEDKKFEVKVNGYFVYCKGSNWVPPDMLYPRLENPRYTPANTIESLLEDAAASNFNMIRVWGGAQYQSDKFLELASRKGIMLFYDFMFSDSIYPATEQFLVNVEEEIKQQVRRARNYPALTLWCGNNEILQGIKDWGWDLKEYKANYHSLFQVLIPKIIQYESPYIPYIPSSPVYGVGNSGFDRGGDVHYWNVWAGGAEFETYQENIGKFNSEFGTQGLPVWETILQGISKKPSYQDPNMLIHQRHGSRFNVLTMYMDQYMRKSINFEMETYQSGLLQAYAIELAIKAQRSSKNQSAGTLFWQMNDAWPAISWSSIDYYGRWKPLQFSAKRLYPDVVIFVFGKNIHAVSDELYPLTAYCLIKFFDLNGTLLSKLEMEVDLGPNEAKVIHKIIDEDYNNANKTQSMIYTEIVAGKGQKMTSTHYNTRYKNMKLYPASIEVQYHEQYNTMTIQTKTTIVKNLFISRSSKYLKTSDNYFDLVPGHPVKVTTLDKDSLADFKNELVFRSYREVYINDSKVNVTVVTSKDTQ